VINCCKQWTYLC